MTISTRFLLGAAVPVAVAFAAHPAAALTITPYFDSTITGASAIEMAKVEGAINAAITKIDGLYSNTGTIGIVFSQANTTAYLGQSEAALTGLTYSNYTSDLAAVSRTETTNTTLSTAVAHLSSGNDANGAKGIALTTADAKLALGLSSTSGNFNASGAFSSSGGTGYTYYGVISLTDSSSLSLNYGATAVSGAYSMIDAAEHEIDEILGGGGQGTTLNTGNSGGYDGVLDLYRYSAPGTPSYSTTASSSYFSVNGGITDIVGFNQTAGNGDYSDFSTHTNVQSASSSPGIVATYNASSPEFAMMESIGYNGIVNTPEPASAAVFIAGLLGLGTVRRRNAGKIQ